MARETRARKAQAAKKAQATMASKTEEEKASSGAEDSPTGDGEIPESPKMPSSKKKKARLGRENKKKLGSSSKKNRRSATKALKQKDVVVEEEDPEEDKEEESEEVHVEEATSEDEEEDDLTLNLKGNMDKLPKLIPGSERNDDITALLTNPESQAVEALKKSVPDLTSRDVTLFLYGYRLKGDHNVKTMQTLLQSMSQCATVLASQNRNIKHTANTLDESLRGAKRSLSTKPGKPPVDKKLKLKAKEEPQEKDIMLDSIEPILNYANKTPEDIFTLYDLSISQIYAALKPVIIAVGNQDYSFLDDSNWPHNMYDLFQEKKMEIVGSIGTSNAGKKKK
jgi:hypothetical protein